MGGSGAHTHAGCACACGPAATDQADTFESETDAATAGIPTACADSPSTAVDGNDRLTADGGTETQLRTGAPVMSAVMTLITPPVAHGGSYVGSIELSGLATEVQSTVSGGQGSLDTPILVDAPRGQHMVRDTGMAEDSRVREHLKLGMTFETCKKVLLEVGVLLEDQSWCDSFSNDRRLTQLRSSYLDQDRWIAQAYPKRLTGYDVAAATRAYNSKQVEQMRSWCERKLSLNEVERVRHKKGWHETRSVGPADVFISHTQADHPSTVMAALEAANDLERGDLRFLDDSAGIILMGVKRGTPLRFWVDLFSLRQSTTDFDLDEVLRLIKEVGLTLAIISKAEDAKDMYFARSFCLVEAYGTLVSKAEFVVLVLKPRGSKEKVAEGSHELGYDLAINSRAAHCRDAKAGEMIKRFIEQRIGFERFDHLLLAGAKQSFTRAAIMRHRRKCCNLGRFCAPSLSRFDHCCDSFDDLLYKLQVDPRFPDCMASACFEIKDCIKESRAGLMGDAYFRMGRYCHERRLKESAYEYGGNCCYCCCHCCEIIFVVGCCDGCCVWNGLSESIAALCCFFLCCPTQYQDEDVRTVGELGERCAQCCSPMYVEHLLGVDACVFSDNACVSTCGEWCQRRIFGDGAESWCEISSR